MNTPSRRSVAKGTAWAVPAVIVGAPAPALGASLPPGLQGMVYWAEDCSINQFTITPADDDGDLYPDGPYGFYVYNTKASQVSNACMTFSFPTAAGSLTWHADSSNGQWSVPKEVASTGSGVTTYQSCYTGAFVDAKNGVTSYATVGSYPSFYASAPNGCLNPLNISIVRTVSVNGQLVTLSRSISVVPS